MKTMETLKQGEVLVISQEDLRAAFLLWYIEFLTNPQPKSEGTHGEIVIRTADYVWHLLDVADE